MHDRPDRADCFAVDVEWNQQAFLSCGYDWQQVWVAALEMSEQQGTILIKHVSAGAEVARGSTSDVRIPLADDSRPIKSLAGNVRPFTIPRQQAKASGITLGNIKDRFSQGLKDGARRIGERANKRDECAVLLFVVGRTPWTAMQLFRAQDRFQRRLWNRIFQSIARRVIRVGRNLLAMCHRGTALAHRC